MFLENNSCMPNSSDYEYFIHSKNHDQKKPILFMEDSRYSNFFGFVK